jgi:hypothetical protein
MILGVSWISLLRQLKIKLRKMDNTTVTSAYYIFKYSGWYYTFYKKGGDSSPYGLGSEIVKEIAQWLPEDFDYIKSLLNDINTNECYNKQNIFYSLIDSLKNPYDYYFIVNSNNVSIRAGIDYIYILDFDKNHFVVRWIDGNDSFRKQTYRLDDIPEYWIDLLE